MKPRLFRNRAAWRRWLESNHESADEIWLLFYKKHTGKQSVRYEEAVEEALCYGWIDSKLKRIDDEKHMQRYTPRKKGSNWASSNKKRVTRLIAEGQMTEAGLRKIEQAKKDGSWKRLDEMAKPGRIPKDLNEALKADPTAKKNFNAFTKSQRSQYLGWLNSAKRPETRSKRIAQIVERAAANIKPGI